MKQMKRIIVFLCAAVICLSSISLGACSSPDNGAATGDSANEKLVVSGNDMIINTEYGKLYYPSSWQDKFDYKIETDECFMVCFLGKISDKTTEELYRIVFADEGAEEPKNAVKTGIIKDKKCIVYLVVKDFSDKKYTKDEINTFYAMQDELNYTTEKLSELDGFERTNPKSK